MAVGIVVAARIVMPEHAQLILVLVLAVGYLLLLAWACVWFLPRRVLHRDTAGGTLATEQQASAINSVRTALVQGAVGLTALLGIVIAWQQFQADRDQARTDRYHLNQQLILTRQGQVAERFTRAVDQLASNQIELRLGGIYGLERIAARQTPAPATAATMGRGWSSPRSLPPGSATTPPSGSSATPRARTWPGSRCTPPTCRQP